MSAQLQMFEPETLMDSTNVISSPELASGATRCDSPDGQTIGQYGPLRARASRSAQPAKGRGRQTSGIFGLNFTALSPSDALSLRLANRLRAKTDLLGSTLYDLTWKVRTTPAGHPIPALRGTARRISVNGSTGWPSPIVNDATGSAYCIDKSGAKCLKLPGAANLTGWPSPQASDGSGGGQAKRATNPDRSNDLNDFALLAGWNSPRATDGSNGGPNQSGGALSHDAALCGWVTASARDWKDGRASAETMDRNSRPLNEQAVQLAGWSTPDSQIHNDGESLESWSRRQAKNRAKHNNGNGAGMPLGMQSKLSSGPARRTASGEILTGSSAQMESGGQLDPAHPRWLMALPPAWDDCGVTAMQSLPRKRRLLSNASRKS